jgi:hypothetical protein
MVDPAKLPLPVRATGFRFLASPTLPTIAVLEVETESNPVRIGFDIDQLEELARSAGNAAARLRL